MDNLGSTRFKPIETKKNQLINTENFRYQIYHMTCDVQHKILSDEQVHITNL